MVSVSAAPSVPFRSLFGELRTTDDALSLGGRPTAALAIIKRRLESGKTDWVARLTGGDAYRYGEFLGNLKAYTQARFQAHIDCWVEDDGSGEEEVNVAAAAVAGDPMGQSGAVLMRDLFSSALTTADWPVSLDGTPAKPVAAWVLMKLEYDDDPSDFAVQTAESVDEKYSEVEFLMQLMSYAQACFLDEVADWED